MAGTIEITLDQLDRLTRRAEIASRADLSDLLGEVGQQQEASARKRISDTKRTPAGERWDPWSKRYAQTRANRHGLLIDEGDLRDRMTYAVDGSHAVRVGSPMVYAATHLFGSADGRTPARAYLDTSGEFEDAEDRIAIVEIVEHWLEDLLR